MTSTQIVDLASLVASDLGMLGLDEKTLLEDIKRNPPMPTILSDTRNQMWVDRHYVAYSSVQEQLVHYMYIAKEHATEELRDLRNDGVGAIDHDLRKDIIRQLKRAQKAERPFYLRAAYRRKMERASLLEI